jgi:hypothetical protein
MVSSTASAGDRAVRHDPGPRAGHGRRLIQPARASAWPTARLHEHQQRRARTPGHRSALNADPTFWRLLGTVQARDVTVLSEDRAAIDAAIEVRSLAKAANDGGLSVFAALVSAGEKDYTYTQQSGMRQLLTGQTVRRDSDGAVFRYKATVDPKTAPVVDIAGRTSRTPRSGSSSTRTSSSSSRTSASTSRPRTPARPRGSSPATMSAGGARSTIDAVTVTATGAITVDATQNASITAENKVVAEAAGGSTASTAVGVNVATNVVLSGAEALVQDAKLVTTGSGAIAVTATNTSRIDATITSSITTKTTGVGITLAFNSIGRTPTNVLFNLVDAVIGTDIGDRDGGEALSAAKTTAIVLRSTVDGAAVTIAALGQTTITATVLASVVSIAAALQGATQVAIGAVIAMNRLSTLVEASASSSPKVAARAGHLSVTSSNASKIASDVSAPAVAVGASIGSGTKISVGVSIARNVIADDVRALLSAVADARATNGSITVGRRRTARTSTRRRRRRPSRSA